MRAGFERERQALFVKLLILISVSLFFLLVVLDNAALAYDFSWGNKRPVVEYVSDGDNVDLNQCHGSYQVETVESESVPQRICMTSGSGIRFGNYHTGYGYQHVIGFSFDSKVYKFSGLCGLADDCLYLPETNILVNRDAYNHLTIYRNFLGRLTSHLSFDAKDLNHVGLSHIDYNFDTSNPDYIFSRSDGYMWAVGGIGVSSNHHWLVFEFRSRGIGLMNVDTLEMKHISGNFLSYDTGMNPIAELAVSNDGRDVVVAGWNSGLTMLEVDSGCTEDANDQSMDYFRANGAHFCANSQIDTEAFVNRFKYATQPKFDRSGGRPHIVSQYFPCYF